MSHPEDPSGCCDLPQGHRIHQPEVILDHLDRLWSITADAAARARIDKRRAALRKLVRPTTQGGAS